MPPASGDRIHARPTEPIGLWRDNQILAVLAARDLPFAFMHQPVVAVTQEHQVSQFSRPALDPMRQVMARRPRRGPVTSRPPAAPIANTLRTPCGGRDLSRRSS